MDVLTTRRNLLRVAVGATLVVLGVFALLAVVPPADANECEMVVITVVV